MPWVKIGDEVADLPKTLIVWSQDPAAFALDTRATIYAAKHLTDGFVPAALLDVWFPDPTSDTSARLTAILVNAGRWSPTEGGFMIHDFLDSNRSKEAVEKERAKRKKTGKTGGERSGDTRRAQARAAIDEQLPE